ncbi:MAG: L,D-transpeptidase family protein [Pseudomonadales bacterium]
MPAFKALNKTYTGFTYCCAGLLALGILARGAPAFAEVALKADHVVVQKAQRKLFLYHGGIVFREYSIALGPRSRGHKQREGDERTPEGRYLLDFKFPDSDYYKAIHISYPNQQDIQRAASLGVDPGGSIMIHGMPEQSKFPDSLVQRFNWTNGCIAVTNREMEEIWHAVGEGTPIDILP